MSCDKLRLLMVIGMHCNASPSGVREKNKWIDGTVIFCQKLRYTFNVTFIAQMKKKKPTGLSGAHYSRFITSAFKNYNHFVLISSFCNEHFLNLKSNSPSANYSLHRECHVSLLSSEPVSGANLQQFGTSVGFQLTIPIQYCPQGQNLLV